MVPRLRQIRSALFLPASNPRAIAKARTAGADLVVLDLEDAVRDEDKGGARVAAVVAAQHGFGGAMMAIRVNGVGRPEHELDCRAVRSSDADVAVLPMVGGSAELGAFAKAAGKPVLAMIETPAAVLAATEIARTPGVVGLIAGTNDLCAATGIRNAAGRAGLVTALQLMVLAARVAGVAAFDGVYNRLDDPAGFDAEAEQGVLFGFDGKALIHPDQVAPTNRIFAPAPAEIEEAQALVEAANGGAQRFRGRMVESLHVEEAKRLLARLEETRS